MKLYGAQVSEKYIEYHDRKKHVRYPNSEEYPTAAIYNWAPIIYNWKKRENDQRMRIP